MDAESEEEEEDDSGSEFEFSEAQTKLTLLTAMEVVSCSVTFCLNQPLRDEICVTLTGIWRKLLGLWVTLCVKLLGKNRVKGAMSDFHVKNAFCI